MVSESLCGSGQFRDNRAAALFTLAADPAKTMISLRANPRAISLAGNNLPESLQRGNRAW
ncbi:hypothetical protein [Rhodopseudomonas palustris]|uniref:Uncharacterized protein n=1 Tax=Rhodopseudomonas palustris TaxID=1076 RepID=A0A418VJ01_RHOPL|nr:hypothetical protein [Rhodopseudomonas palustris]RJF76076.1 hypothetical protein D4Q52_07925 [Rhodopseudomonas palustris]